MSTEATTWAKALTVGSANRKVVLLLLADYADAEWSAFAGQATLAEQAELSERTVRTVLRAFEDEHLIRRVARFRKDGSRTSDRIYLNPEWRPPANPTTGKSSSDHRQTTTVTTGKAIAGQEPSEEPSEEPSGSWQQAQMMEVEPVERPRARRAADPLWDALVAEMGYQPGSATERGAWNRAVKQLREVGATADDVAARCAEYRERWTTTLTPSALVKHWGALSITDRPRTGRESAADALAATLGVDGWQERPSGPAIDVGSVLHHGGPDPKGLPR